MTRESRDGTIEVITGVMFSGKSEELLRRVRRAVIARKSVQLFKSHLDDRYSGVHSISSHDGRRVEARPVSASLEIIEHAESGVDVVAIDEVQFLDDRIVEVVNRLADRGQPPQPLPGSRHRDPAGRKPGAGAPGR